MNAREIDLLTRRKDFLTAIVKANHSIAKPLRDVAAVEYAEQRISVINRWLKGKPATEAPEIKLMGKTEFKNEFKKVFTAPDPDSVMVVDDVETLRAAWKQILANNIQISTKSPQVKAEMKRLIKEGVSNIKIDGFR